MRCFPTDKPEQENIQLLTAETGVDLTLKKVTEESGDVFKGQDCMEGRLHLEIDKSVTPVINPLAESPLHSRRS